MTIVKTLKAARLADAIIKNTPELTVNEKEKLEHIKAVSFKIDGDVLTKANREHIMQNRFRLIARIKEALIEEDYAFFKMHTFNIFEIRMV